MLILKNLDTTELGSKQIRLLQPYHLQEVITNMASFFENFLARFSYSWDYSRNILASYFVYVAHCSCFLELLEKMTTNGIA